MHLGAAWGMAMVTSRAFRPHGPAQPAAMLPLVDMCNHSFSPNCSVQPQGDRLALVTSTQVRAPRLWMLGRLPHAGSRRTVLQRRPPS